MGLWRTLPYGKNLDIVIHTHPLQADASMNAEGNFHWLITASLWLCFMTGVCGALCSPCLECSLASRHGECFCFPLLLGSTLALRVSTRERHKIRVSISSTHYSTGPWATDHLTLPWLSPGNVAVFDICGFKISWHGSTTRGLLVCAS